MLFKLVVALTFDLHVLVGEYLDNSLELSTEDWTIRVILSGFVPYFLVDTCPLTHHSLRNEPPILDQSSLCSFDR